MVANKFLRFTEREVSLYPTYRPMYRVGQILLVLYYNGYSGKASLLKLHLFSWALKSQVNLTVLKDFVASNYHSDLKFFGIESTLNRALNLAYAERLIDFDKGSYKLLEKGRAFAKELDNDDEIFLIEKPILKFIGKKIPEKIIDNLTRDWKNA